MSTTQIVIEFIVGLFGIGLVVGAFGYTIALIIRRIRQRKER